MKVTTTDALSSKTLDYPKLMVSPIGLIVLMTSYGVGVQLSDAGGFSLGCAVDSNTKHWSMSCFTDYTGTITLENSNE